nr:immunoglobulin heavy chain junction region [Macaca mulatta]MOW98518.1 immunoglobulin heavy chain junction region [Macaca mulatta]MOW98784.1 immunoglobulin heavy chain junction region [Macaca mulatta]MOW99002.1 immunoglobulin heavy chain junction region [Macaca mulatta]MOW99596.1 immunoglobulin heavy chain junction region [Macaca mulatta]
CASPPMEVAYHWYFDFW